MNHTLYECPPGCDYHYCNYCEGGLALCTACGGAEASLPTHCPGARMTGRQEWLVTARWLDFKDGAWVWTREGAPATEGENQ